MSRIIKSKNKVSRRYGINIFSTNSKKLRLQTLPGGLKPGKSSIYKTQLYAKQVVFYYYFGLGNKTLKDAHHFSRTKDVPSESFCVYLEEFLSSFLRSMGCCKSILQINQKINHGHVKINGKVVRYKKYRLKVGDKVEVQKMTQEFIPNEYTEITGPNTFTYLKDIQYKYIKYPFLIQPQKCIDFYNR